MFKKFSLVVLCTGGFMGGLLPVYSQDAEPTVVPETNKEEAQVPVVKTQDDLLAEKRVLEIAKKLSIKEQEAIATSKNYVKLGEDKFNKLEYALAEGFFVKALEVYPNNEEAKKLLHKTEAILGKSEKDRFVGVETLQGTEQVIILQYRAEVENELAFARALIDEAINLVDKAPEGEQMAAIGIAEKKLVMASDKYINIQQQLAIRREAKGFDLKGYQDKVSKGLEDVSKLLDQLIIRRKKLANEIAIKNQKEENERSRNYFKEKISKLLDIAYRELKLKNYDEAERIARQVLREEPNNRKAEGIIKTARSRRHKNFDKNVPKIFEDAKREGFQVIDELEIPYQDVIVYPAEWEDYIMHRMPDSSVTIAKAPWKIALQQKLEQPVFFDFTNTGFREGLLELGELTGVTIAFDKKLWTEAGVAPDAPIEMVANGMSLKNALKWILSNVNAQYSLFNQAVYILPQGQVAGDTIMQTYSILDLITPPKSFKAPELQQSAGGLGGFSDIEDIPEDPLTGDNIKELIMEKIGKDTWDDQRGTSIEVFQGKLLVVHQEEMHEKISEFLSELRKAQTLQVVIQTRFIDVSEGTVEEIGVSWRGLDQASVDDVGILDQAGAGYLSNVSKLDDYDARGVINNSSQVSSFARPYNPAPRASGDGLFASYAILGNVQAQAVLHAVETNGNGIELMAPSVTVFNNSTAHIDVATSRNYIRDYDVIDGSFDPQIDQFFEGVVLEVKPTVSSDRKYITMEVKPTLSSLMELRSFSFNAIAGVGGGNNNNNNNNGAGLVDTFTLSLQVPNIRYEKLRTTVNLPDRGVVLLGGLMRGFKGDNQTGVPLLSNIPFLGRLFKNKATGKAKSNLLISMSGRIVIFDEIENKL